MLCTLVSLEWTLPQTASSCCLVQYGKEKLQCDREQVQAWHQRQALVTFRHDVCRACGLMLAPGAY